MIQVTKKLYIGQWEDEYDLYQKNPNRIANIVLAGIEQIPSNANKFDYYKVGIFDVKPVEFDRRAFDRSNEFISKAHDKEKCVLVVSYKTQTLAQMIVVAYLIKRLKMTYETAIKHLISKKVDVLHLKKHNIKILKNFEAYMIQQKKDPRNAQVNYNYMENMVSPYQTKKSFFLNEGQDVKRLTDNQTAFKKFEDNITKDNEKNLRATKVSTNKLKTGDKFTKSAYNVLMPYFNTTRSSLEQKTSSHNGDQIEHDFDNAKLETYSEDENIQDDKIEITQKDYLNKKFYNQKSLRELANTRRQAFEYLNNLPQRMMIPKTTSKRLKEFSYSKRIFMSCEYMHNNNEQLQKPPELNLAQKGKEFWQQFKGTQFGRRIRDVFYNGDANGIDKINNFMKNKRKNSEKTYVSYMSKKIGDFNDKRSKSTPKKRSENIMFDLESDSLKNYQTYNPIKSLASSRTRTESPQRKKSVNFIHMDANVISSIQTPKVLNKYAKQRDIWKNHNMHNQPYNQNIEKDSILNWENFCMKKLSNSVYLFCKSCGYNLLSQEFVIPHIKKQSDKSTSCKGVFLKKKDFQLKYNISNGSVIECPGCTKVIGFADARGLCCSCGFKEIPAYMILKKEVNVKI